MKAFDENRFGLVVVDPERIMTLLNFTKNPREFLAIADDNIPADAVAINVGIDHSRNAIVLRICSEQLPVLKPGEAAPILNGGPLEWQAVRLETIVARNKPHVVVVTDLVNGDQALYLNGERRYVAADIWASDIVHEVGDTLFTMSIDELELGDNEFPQTLAEVQTHHSKRSEETNAGKNEGNHDSAAVCQSDNSSGGGNSEGCDGQTV